MDSLTPEKRSWNMSRIPSKNTKPEELVRKYLFSKGFRYRKNDKRLPGKPDMVLPKYKTVIFVNGCFWHNHKDCQGSRLPKTNTAFWKNKLENNTLRDKQHYKKLTDAGWRIIIVWECSLKNKQRIYAELERVVKELKSDT